VADFGHLHPSRRQLCSNWNMAQPDWTEIFTARPDLSPPGYNQIIEDMRNNPWKPPHKKARSKPGKQGRGSFPGLKHSAD